MLQVCQGVVGVRHVETREKLRDGMLNYNGLCNKYPGTVMNQNQNQIMGTPGKVGTESVALHLKCTYSKSSLQSEVDLSIDVCMKGKY